MYREKFKKGFWILSIEVERDVLERACKEMIETILLCLPNAYKGTIYLIGKPPDLIAQRITSGIVNDNGRKISWGLPAKSEYNPPGKPWIDYRDQPDRPLEAMAWCVDKQKSWTAEDPKNDCRSIRLQFEGEQEDFHHMEPVLVHKSDLNLDMYSSMEYPRDFDGNFVWTNTDYLVVAVIKIHFRPYSIKIGGPETVVIKKLSRSLGTELLSHQLHKDAVDATHQLAQDRLSACDILADSLRNAITKSGLIFSLVKQEIGELRNQWEQAVLADRQEKDMKEDAIKDLNAFLMDMGADYEEAGKDLIRAQNKFLTLLLSPEKGENWVMMQIEERWKDFLNTWPQEENKSREILQTIEKLKTSLYFGQNRDIVESYDKIPDELKWRWVDLLYKNTDSYRASAIENLIEILENPAIDLPSREKSRKTLTHLKALGETMNQLERNTNFLLRQVLNGGDRGFRPELPNHVKLDSDHSDTPVSDPLPRLIKLKG